MSKANLLCTTRVWNDLREVPSKVNRLESQIIVKTLEGMDTKRRKQDNHKKIGYNRICLIEMILGFNKNYIT